MSSTGTVGGHEGSLPHDVEAELYVLGAIMLSATRALNDVEEIIVPTDFYRESHGTIFHVVTQMHAEGTHVEPVTVADRLDMLGLLDKVGGKAKLHEITASVPASSNAAHYAKIVKELSTLRQLIIVGEQIRQLGWERQQDAAGLVDQAEQFVFELGLGRVSSDFVRLRDAVKESVEQVVYLYENELDLTGVPSGFELFDKLTSGFQAGNLIILAARPAMGKGLRLDAPILTPTGWRRNGDLHVGDRVIGADGHPTTVTGVFDRGEMDFYRVTFADGATVDCSEDHLWLTRTRDDRRANRPGTVRETLEIRETLRRRDGNGWNHSVPYVKPVVFDNTDVLPLDPYWLGLYLGDGDSGGSVRFTKPESDLMRAFSKNLPDEDTATQRNSSTVTLKRKVRTGQPSATLTALRSLGLSGLGSHERFIPDRYLHSTIENRTSLLQGLCDTDGYVTDPGGACVEISTSSKRLCEGIMFLVGSLGGRAHVTERPTHYVKNGERRDARCAYRIVLSFPRGSVTPVRSLKHLAKWRGGPHQRGRERMITGIEPIERQQCRCISVERSLYVTDGFVVTHNSGMVLCIAAHVAVRAGIPVAVFSLEMSKSEVTQRLICSEANVESQKIMHGRFNPDDWPRVASACDRLFKAPLFIEDKGSLSMAELRSKARRLKTREPKLGLIIVDYLQLMATGSIEHKVQEIAQISRQLKILARDLDIPIVVLSQLNRQVEQRHDKRPVLSDLRDSGSIEQDADLVAFIYRDEYYNGEESDQQGVAELILAKHRNGPTGVVRLSFLKRYAKFLTLPE